MRKKINFSKLPQNFKDEKDILIKNEIYFWESLMIIDDIEISEFIKGTIGTKLNLKRLRCIASLIVELDISQEDASLLIYSGVSSKKALAGLTPNELIRSTGRLERLLKTNRIPAVSLEKANALIKKAKQANN